jgi:CHASE2 domain-containing sensor protein
MTESSRTRTNIAAFLAILTLSSATMVWLFWHFPVITTLVTVAVLAGLGISARLARSIDCSDLNELQGGKQGV